MWALCYPCKSYTNKNDRNMYTFFNIKITGSGIGFNIFTQWSPFIKL